MSEVFLYLARKKLAPPRTLEQDCAQGPWGGAAVSYDRCIPLILKLLPRAACIHLSFERVPLA